MDCIELIEILRGSLPPSDTFLIAILAASIEGGTLRDDASRNGKSGEAMTAVGDGPVIQSG